MRTHALLIPTIVGLLVLSPVLSPFSNSLAWAQDRLTETPQAPESRWSGGRLSFGQVFTEIPTTSMRTLHGAFSRNAILPWAIIASTSALTYYYDEDLLLEIQQQGRDMGIGNDNKMHVALRAADQDILRLPASTGASLYFLGDGWTHFGIAAGFMATGYFAQSNRAWNTSMQIMHGMLTSTLFNQAIKRSTGREAPNQRTEERGAWRPFPSIKAYQGNTEKYDAVPSGHMMTATLTFTIISTNYPEHRAWVLPLAGVWLTALGWQMVNNGVHWASDYPLGIAMGYYIGKLSTRMGQPDSPSVVGDKSKIHWIPSVQDGVYGLTGLYYF